MFDDFSAIAPMGGMGLVKDEVEKLIEMQKAFMAGGDINIADLTGGQAGRVQYLEDAFKTLTAKENAAAFWRDIPKDPVDSTVLEWSRINEVAGMVTYEEGGDVDNQDDDMDRKYDVVKYMGVKGTVTFAAKSTKMIQAAEVTETQNKMKSMARGMDLLCWFGNKSHIPSEFNGLIEAVRQASDLINPNDAVYDLRGKRMKDSIINESCTYIADNYGNPNGLQVWLSNAGAQGWVDDKIQNGRLIQNTNQPLSINYQLSDFSVENGTGLVKKDVYLRSRNVILDRLLNKAKTAFVANHTKAPSVPTCTISTVTAVSIGELTYSMDPGDYDYAIVARNRFGSSVALETTISVVGAGNVVKMVLAESSPVTGQEVKCYDIYRRAGASSNIKDYKLVTTVGLGTQYDTGEFIPGTSWGAIIDWDSTEVFRFAQLLPMYKLYYGIRADKLEWLQKLYGTLQVYNPNRIRLFKNVGTLPW